MTDPSNIQSNQGSRRRWRIGAIGLGVVLLALLVARVSRPDPLRTDREFHGDSRIETQELSPIQVENLAVLGKVWGFAKYHHPHVTAGRSHWDFELFRILPAILESTTREEAAQRLTDWLRSFGELQPCADCTSLPPDLHLAPDTAWILDASSLGSELSGMLARILENRPSGRRQFYVSHARLGNPRFTNELAYRDQTSPDAGYRLLALFRLWNIIEYWFPYRNVIGEDWHTVLTEFVPRLMAAEGDTEYRLEMLQLIARINDTHANLWSDLNVRPPTGTAHIPVSVRFIENRAVVTGYTHPESGLATGLIPGDILVRLNDMPVDSLVAAWRPYYAASNEPTRLRDIARSLTRGDAGEVSLTIQRNDSILELAVARIPLSPLRLASANSHDLSGETFRMLTDEVAYLKLSSIRRRGIAGYLREAAEAKVLVVDIRNYPKEFVVFALGERLVAEPTEFVQFTLSYAAHPGAFAWSRGRPLKPRNPRYSGAVVILVDESTQSQAEYTAMALRASPNALVVGSTTAGADGNVSSFVLPGNLSAMISGIGIFYPDRTPTQRVGVVPDLEVRPTIEGIRAGRDEVLDAAVSHALGRDFSHVAWDAPENSARR